MTRPTHRSALQPAVSPTRKQPYAFAGAAGAKKECWYSLQGFLLMKCQSGAFSIFLSKKRFYFGLEEVGNELVYYKDQADFDRCTDEQGSISLDNSLCTLLEGNLCVFMLHTGGKRYMLEAENESSADCWLNALQHRRETPFASYAGAAAAAEEHDESEVEEKTPLIARKSLLLTTKIEPKNGATAEHADDAAAAEEEEEADDESSVAKSQTPDDAVNDGGCGKEQTTSGGDTGISRRAKRRSRSLVLTDSDSDGHSSSSSSSSSDATATDASRASATSAADAGAKQRRRCTLAALSIVADENAPNTETDSMGDGGGAPHSWSAPSSNESAMPGNCRHRQNEQPASFRVTCCATNTNNIGTSSNNSAPNGIVGGGKRATPTTAEARAETGLIIRRLSLSKRILPFQQQHSLSTTAAAHEHVGDEVEDEGGGGGAFPSDESGGGVTKHDAEAFGAQRQQHENGDEQQKGAAAVAPRQKESWISTWLREAQDFLYRKPPASIIAQSSVDEGGGIGGLSSPTPQREGAGDDGDNDDDGGLETTTRSPKEDGVEAAEEATPKCEAEAIDFVNENATKSCSPLSSLSSSASASPPLAAQQPSPHHLDSSQSFDDAACGADSETSSRSTGTTSPCDSHPPSVCPSLPCAPRQSRQETPPLTLEEELCTLRSIGNRQKEIIEELSVQNSNLATELNRIRAATPVAAVVAAASVSPPATASIANGCAQVSPYSIMQPLSPSLDQMSTISAQNRFLNSELLRLNDRCLIADKQIDAYKKRVAEQLSTLGECHREYVFLLQSCIRIPLYENCGADVVQIRLYGGDVHERRVKVLLAQARELDPSLPTFESVTKKKSQYIDVYGYRHSFDHIPHALQYIATQLTDHYDSQTAEYVALKRRWRATLDAATSAASGGGGVERIEKTTQNKRLARMGVPRSMRPRVWRMLIRQQVAELKSKYGPYYYRNLCSARGTQEEKFYSTAHQKQVNLDLLRTMPNNIHFMSATCRGVTNLQSVLRAFCLHNPVLGYGQGMNFLAATALLFVGPEDAFWFLVAITELYFNASYFGDSFSGALADQFVLKELVEQKLPRLAKHLADFEIDLTTITFNWFIALFFDAVPFKTMLRIWDCFLFEGPKVLFRFTIALLSLYEEEILERTDTISVLKLLKATIKHMYDADGLVRHAFESLKPFPSRAMLQKRRAQYLPEIRDRLDKRQQLRLGAVGFQQFSAESASTDCSDRVVDLSIETICVNPFERSLMYVCIGSQKFGKLALISFHGEAVNLNTTEVDFDCRPISMVVCRREIAFVSLLSGWIVCLHLVENEAKVVWELKLSDVTLTLVHCEQRLFFCLANGSLAVLDNAIEKRPTAFDLHHIPVAVAPITDALIDGDHLLLSAGCKIVILNRNTLSTVGHYYVAAAAAGNQIPMFEKIRALCASPFGVWVVKAHSSLLQLWRDQECHLLFDITYDHSHRRPSVDDPDNSLDVVEINCVLYHDDEIWVGTMDGYLMLYRLINNNDSDEQQTAAAAGDDLLNSAPSSCFSSVPNSPIRRRLSLLAFLPLPPFSPFVASSPSAKYPSGKRLAPVRSLYLDTSTGQLLSPAPRTGDSSNGGGQTAFWSSPPNTICGDGGQTIAAAAASAAAAAASGNGCGVGKMGSSYQHQQAYYIPTESEARHEETARARELLGKGELTRKVSVRIDNITREAKYYVNEEPVRQSSVESNDHCAKHASSRGGADSGTGSSPTSNSLDDDQSCLLSPPAISTYDEDAQILLQPAHLPSRSLAHRRRGNSIDSTLTTASMTTTTSECSPPPPWSPPPTTTTTNEGGVDEATSATLASRLSLLKSRRGSGCAGRRRVSIDLRHAPASVDEEDEFDFGFDDDAEHAPASPCVKRHSEPFSIQTIRLVPSPFDEGEEEEEERDGGEEEEGASDDEDDEEEEAKRHILEHDARMLSASSEEKENDDGKDGAAAAGVLKLVIGGGEKGVDREESAEDGGLTFDLESTQKV